MKTVGIIGGKGKTGSQFARIFRGLGFKVLVSDLGTKLSNGGLIEKSDIVVFSVPLHLSNKIISKEIKNCARKDQLILDVSSLKEKQVKLMNLAKGEVIGMHPLFGPSAKDFKDLTIVLCPGRCSRKTLSELENLMKKVGFRVMVMTPKEHDKLMAVVQVIPHLKTILAGELLKFLGVNLAKSYEISTPIYKLELDIIGRIFSQNGSLYGSIIAENPNSKKLIKFLKKTVGEYDEFIEKGDVDALNNRFDGVKKFLGGFTAKAYKDSEEILKKIQK